MAEIITMGEIIVEIMRASVDEPLDRAGTFRGPFPSGAPAIFIDTAARLGHSAKIIGGVGNFRRNLKHIGIDIFSDKVRHNVRVAFFNVADFIIFTRAREVDD